MNTLRLLLTAFVIVTATVATWATGFVTTDSGFPYAHDSGSHSAGFSHHADGDHPLETRASGKIAGVGAGSASAEAEREVAWTIVGANSPIWEVSLRAEVICTVEATESTPTEETYCYVDSSAYVQYECDDIAFYAEVQIEAFIRNEETYASTFGLMTAEGGEADEPNECAATYYAHSGEHLKVWLKVGADCSIDSTRNDVTCETSSVSLNGGTWQGFATAYDGLDLIETHPIH